MNLTIYFDFVCPFTNRFYQFLKLVKDERELDIDWRPFVLGEQTRSGDQPIWEQENVAEHGELMSLAGLEVLKADEKNVDEYVTDMFALWHGGEATPGIDDVRQLLSKYDLTNAEKHVNRVIDSHHAGQKLGVFGSPSVLFEDVETPLFIKLDHLADKPVESLDLMVGMARDKSILEMKNPS